MSALIAFSSIGGSVIDDVLVKHTSYETTGGSEDGAWFAVCTLANWWNGGLLCFLADGFSPPGASIPLEHAGFPMAGVAIRPAREGAPLVMVSDGRHDKIGFAFSPHSGFSEVFRAVDPERIFATPPVVLPDGNTAMGTREGTLTFTGANLKQPSGLAVRDGRAYAARQRASRRDQPRRPHERAQRQLDYVTIAALWWIHLRRRHPDRIPLSPPSTNS